MEELISKLNPSQKECVLNNEGPMMVIAGAGSGKTRVLTHKIAYLISKGISPENILALTFTNKAAKEMKNRISEMIGGDSKKLWMGTFHSIFSRVLRIEAEKLGYNYNFTIYDSNDSKNLIRAIIKEMNLDKDIYKDNKILGRISSFKNNLITPKYYDNSPEHQEEDSKIGKPRTGDIYREYVDRCFRSNVMDFDDLLLKTNELFTRFPEVVEKYRNRFKYILVDEYQDTNHSQYLIVKSLAKEHKNICVVGDDSQSIYAFRGANIGNILHFESDYPNTKKIKLEQNYRSTKNIVLASGEIIKNNKKQIKKNTFTENEEGEKIKIYKAENDFYEGDFVAKTIYEEKAYSNYRNGDFAVLYRTNSQSRIIEDSLRKKNIPYRIWGGLSFYQRKEVKDIIAYMKLCINKNDDESLKRIINFPTRGIGSTTLEKIQEISNHYNRNLYNVLENLDKIDLNINKGTRGRIKDFLNLMEGFRENENDVSLVAENITKETGLLRTLQQDTTPEGISKMQNMEELLNGINEFSVQYEKENGERPSMNVYLEEVSLATDMDKDIEEEDRVILMTIHSAKGLEFSNVFIVGMEEDLFPSSMSSNNEEDMEEERRLFYVALTRAETNLYLSYADQRFKYGKRISTEPSLFLKELNENYTKYLNLGAKEISLKSNFTGSNIEHNLFGNINLRVQKPKSGIPPQDEETPTPKLRNIKPLNTLKNMVNTSIKLSVGNKINHNRFGIGNVISIEGEGADTRAHIKFETSGIKKILLSFAKIEILD